MITNRKIFITGGAGFLGKSLVARYYDNNEITIYSRDESKHYFLKKRFPKINCIVGDIRNENLFITSSKGHNMGIFAASMKQIEAVTDNVEEANQIIVQGAINAKKAVLAHEMPSVFISSDKSRAPTTIYGAMKYIAGESFIIGQGKHLCSTVLYGNVADSSGSVIRLIHDSIKYNYTLKLYSTEMTRFMIEIGDAMDAIEYSLRNPGYNTIPKLSSFRIKDLFEIFAEELGLVYTVGVPRPNEKIHEIMISSEEIPRVQSHQHYYLMHPSEVCSRLTFPNNEFSSADVVIPKEELRTFLKERNFYHST